MKQGDIYRKKGKTEIIQIDTFATHIDNTGETVVIFHDVADAKNIIGKLETYCKYGTQKEIETEYDLLVQQIDLRNYKSWDDVYALAR